MQEIEALKSLVAAFERMEIQLRKVKRDLVFIHNSDEPTITKDNIRAECLVLASHIGNELDSINFWNIRPAIDKAREVIAHHDQLSCEEKE
jgi:hypothetical protein